MTSANFDLIAWIFLVSAPFLAALVALTLFNAFSRTQRRDNQRERDHWRNMDYLSWRECVKAQGGIRPISRSQLFGVVGSCFLFEHGAFLYEPLTPHFQCGTVEDPLVEPPRSMPVGEGWSVMDGFGGVRQISKGTLCVTSDDILFRGVSAEVRIPLREVHTVVSSCSGLLIGAESSEIPFLFGEINGQKFRDVVSYLMEA